MTVSQKEDLFEQIIEKHDSMIRGVVIKRIGSSNPEWKDIIQNIYLSIWIALDRTKEKGMIGAYIYPIIDWRINDYLRCLYSRKRLIEKAEEKATEDSPYEKEREIEKEKKLGFLTPAEFWVFKLVGQGKTNDEIADSLSITKNTMKSHYHKVVQKLEFNNRTKLALFSYKFLNGNNKEA